MRVLITGTTGGIGSAVRQAALNSGCQVVEVNRADFETLERIEGTFDGVVFSTGMCPVRPITLMDEADFAETMRVNCTLFWRLVKALVKGRHCGTKMKVIAVSSVSAVEGWPGGSAYCASKGGLSALCRALDAELGPRGVSVTALEPRYVKTKMFDSCAGRMGVDPACAQNPDEFARKVIEMLASAG